MSPSMLHRWREQFEPELAPGTVSNQDDREEVERLRRKLRDLEAENSLLKSRLTFNGSAQQPQRSVSGKLQLSAAEQLELGRRLHVDSAVSLMSIACDNIAQIKMANGTLSGQLALRVRSWGGARAGTGRKRRRRTGGVPHVVRAEHRARRPVHVTLRLSPGLPSLRSQVIGGLVRRAFRDTWRSWYRVIQYSIQSNHLHLLVEADDGKSLSRGTSALTIRMARRMNALLGRKGTVFPERYHARSLKTPREVRHALAYVLLNARKHGVVLTGLDPYSSGATFDGWSDGATVGRWPPIAGVNAEAPRTWLLARGWRIHGNLPPRRPTLLLLCFSLLKTFAEPSRAQESPLVKITNTRTLTTGLLVIDEQGCALCQTVIVDGGGLLV